MSLASGLPQNTRRLVDAGLSVNIALPTASGTCATNWINLGQPGATSAYWTNNTAGTTTPPTASNTAPYGPYAATERVFINGQVTSSANGGNNGNAGGNALIYLQQALTLSNGAVDTGNVTNVPLRSNFVTANVPWLVALSGGTNGVTLAANIIDTLPPNIPQYIRLYCVSQANTANMADATMTLSVYF